MKNLSAIISDLYIVVGEEMTDFLELDRSNPVQSILGILYKQNISDSIKLKDWIKTFCGSFLVKKILKHLYISFDKNADVDSLITEWFSYRGIGLSLPRARPLELAKNLRELTYQLDSMSENIDIKLLTNTWLELLMRYVSFFYAEDIWNVKNQDYKLSSVIEVDSDEFNKFLSNFSLTDFCEFINIDFLVHSYPYNTNRCQKNMYISNEKTVEILRKIHNFNLDNNDNLSFEAKYDYCKYIRNLINIWYPDDTETILPIGLKIQHNIRSGFQNEFLCYDNTGKEITLGGYEIELNIGDDILLNAKESGKIWVTKLRPLPEGDKWTTPNLKREFTFNQQYTKDKVFISYSHDDINWLDKIRIHLAPYQRIKNLSIWIDSDIKPGDNRMESIRKSLNSAKVAVLLVSANYLASDFIANEELPYIIQSAKNNDLSIIWVLISNCAYHITDIKNIEPAHDIANPISTLPSSEAENIFVTICENIYSVFNAH